MATRKRDIQMKFWVTEEKALMEEKMKQLPTQRYGDYFRKMAIDGYIIYTDTADMKEMNKALSAFTFNQMMMGANISSISSLISARSPSSSKNRGRR